MQSLYQPFSKIKNHPGALISLSLITILLSGCQGHLKKIKKYEQERNNTEIIQITHQSPFAPITAFDSAQIISQELKVELNTRINSLNNQIDSLQIKIDKAKLDIKNTLNPQMEKALKKGLNSLYIKQSRLRNIDSLFKNAPEKTLFKNQISAAQRLASKKDSIVGYRLHIQFKGIEGKLPVDTFNRTYVFDLPKKNIKGIMIE